MKKMTLKDQVEFFRCMTLSMLVMALSSFVIFEHRVVTFALLFGLACNAYLAYTYDKKYKEEEAAKAAEEETVSEE